MIACVCRNISDSGLTAEELLARLRQSDICCGRCISHYRNNTTTQEKS
jgi:hypothetical protein